MESIGSSQANPTEKKTVSAIGRWMPIHNGHKAFLVNLAKEYDKLIIMIGSCYTKGDIRYAITTTERDKMLRAIMKAENIPEEKFEITPVEDKPTFEEWISDVLEVCETYKATHFCTGNKEDILDVLEKREEPLNLELINPEEGSDFPYHATDIRNMIINGEYEKLQEVIPDEIKPILFKYTFKEIIAAAQNRGQKFIEGRQTVDMILLVRDINDGKVYVLLGNRPEDKEDFPDTLALPGDGINRFELPIYAAIRAFYEETGIKIKMLDNTLEPAIVKFENVPNSPLQQMCMVGIYGSKDEKVNGSKGGSSECFAILAEGDLKDYEKVIKESNGLKHVKFYDVEKISENSLAFQHKDMLKKAISMLEAYPNLIEEIAHQ